MKTIYALTDYKKFFGSKYKSEPYRSGFDQKLLQKYFTKYGYEIEFIPIKDVSFAESNWKGKVVIYTSSEEVGLHYKSFIEDIVYGLQKAGAIVLPEFAFLRANNNKVFMELLREQVLGEDLSGNLSKLYGSLDELQSAVSENNIEYPCVIKKSAGALSRGVFLVKDRNELLKKAKIISRTPHFLSELKEKVRTIKHSGYSKESKYQGKFIIQQFIPDLKNDWKILIYHDHYYILNRGVKENDFRASGSHYNYKAGSKSEFPIHMLDEVQMIYKKLNVPHLSLDYAYDGKRGYVIEIQAVHFGTSTIEMCDGYFTKENNKWIVKPKVMDQEEEYVYGLVKYLGK